MLRCVSVCSVYGCACIVLCVQSGVLCNAVCVECAVCGCVVHVNALMIDACRISFQSFSNVLFVGKPGSGFIIAVVVSGLNLRESVCWRERSARSCT